ncbi:MAG: hypothetical protein MUE53_08855, partial [Chitinophagales bacterium]|nr:hypothetical protein [Chitinophagales bacterium]
QDYKTSVMFGSEGIIGCKCDCKAGSYNDKKIICVHILPVLLQFTVLLFDGLSEHLLCELANTWSSMSDVPNEKTESVFNSVQKLVVAAGRTLNGVTKSPITQQCILDLLKDFMVVTQQFNCGPGPPNVSTLGPQVEIKYRSASTKIENIIKNQNKNKSRDNNEKKTIMQNVINYNKINYLIDVTKQWFETLDDLLVAVGSQRNRNLLHKVISQIFEAKGRRYAYPCGRCIHAG